ncbi:type 1 glutamine amidotransferase [Roseospirillum parvum]|uniref:GMP synthase-Glutamine amidotransferase n=1 Tax=Roseospirillum parvum TaxID=83401 RepID=A0A1G7ZHL5_9PROT|nr:type 1 glutamine amidotransferase [Roseospirillum parvum]SDH08198.1 GMP synthase-Glutamine amidotransferase [Roseospirillum parvum]
MHILVILNDELDPPGLIGQAIFEREGYYDSLNPHQGYHSTAPHQPAALPDSPGPYDALVVMGGPQDSWDDAGHPAFPPIRALIAAFHAAGRPVLGVCLGAQLMAQAFGAEARRMERLEVGMVPLVRTPAGRADPLLGRLAAEPVFMQWHQDTFDLPPGAELLLSGDDCPNQAFRLGDTAYGFQCHFEVTADIVREWLRYNHQDLGRRRPDVLAAFESQLRSHLRQSRRDAEALIDGWLDLVEARRAGGH